jgi:hypothetical protein
VNRQAIRIINRYRAALIAAALAVLGGCASVQPLGNDTYTSDAVRPIRAANAFCRQQGRVAEPAGNQSSRMEFVFRCVPEAK